jgi:hypothetical protein
MRILSICALILGASFTASAQAGAIRDPLLDQMTGKWVLQGTIAGHETTHDIEVDWVLRDEYVRLHETSRETNAQGQAAYEAIVFIAAEQATHQYKCLWLDSTGGGGLHNEGVADGKRTGDEIVFLFNDKDGSVHTTFSYNKSSDTWQWLIDNEMNGKPTPFARVKLTRK